MIQAFHADTGGCRRVLDSLFILVQMISIVVLLTWALRRDSEED